MRVAVEEDEKDEQRRVGWIQRGEQGEERAGGAAVCEHVELCAEFAGLVQDAGGQAVDCVEGEAEVVVPEEVGGGAPVEEGHDCESDADVADEVWDVQGCGPLP